MGLVAFTAGEGQLIPTHINKLILTDKHKDKCFVLNREKRAANWSRAALRKSLSFALKRKKSKDIVSENPSSYTTVLAAANTLASFCARLE